MRPPGCVPSGARDLDGTMLIAEALEHVRKRVLVSMELEQQSRFPRLDRARHTPQRPDLRSLHVELQDVRRWLIGFLQPLVERYDRDGEQPLVLHAAALEISLAPRRLMLGVGFREPPDHAA